MGDSSYRRHGLHFWAERVVEWFEHPRLQIEVPQIIIHELTSPMFDCRRSFGLRATA